MRLTESIRRNKHADFMKELKSECAQYLKDTITGKDSISLMFSGRSGASPYLKGTVRKGRQPMDMNPEIHKDIDDQFKKKFGIRGRSECLFTTGDLAYTRNYGNSYIIFPKGKYRILWSPKIKDLFQHVQQFYNYNPNYPTTNVLKIQIMDNLGKTDIDNEVESAYKKYIEGLVDMYIISPTRIPTHKAIDSERELMVSCREYYAIKYPYWSELTYEYEKQYGSFL